METLGMILLLLTSAVPVSGILLVGSIHKFNEAKRLLAETKQLSLRVLARSR